MTDVQIRVMSGAVKVRLNRGQNQNHEDYGKSIDDILLEYPKLTQEDRELIKAELELFLK